MASVLDQIGERARKIFARHKGKKFLDGSMAAAALVAIADGDASLEEGAEVGRLLRVLESLRDHQPQQGVDKYLEYVSALKSDFTVRQELRQTVVDAADESEEAAALLLVICRAVSEADGRVIESEVREIKKLAGLLGIDYVAAHDQVLG